MAPLALTPTVITVNRESFNLDLWKLRRAQRYQRVKRYPIAVGAIGKHTPAGLYFVESKSKEPAWLHDGVIYPFSDDRNPFEGGFISLAKTNGVGIHGVRFDPHLGERASHGCIRMGTPDLLEMWGKVPIGTPVFIY